MISLSNVKEWGCRTVVGKTPQSESQQSVVFSKQNHDFESRCPFHHATLLQDDFFTIICVYFDL